MVESEDFMKIFRVVVDDGVSAFATFIVAKDLEELYDVWSGNGEFLKVADVTSEYFYDDLDRQKKFFSEFGLSNIESEFLARLIIDSKNLV